jgi:hypothetical protein
LYVLIYLHPVDYKSATTIPATPSMPGRAVFMAPADEVALLAAELALLEAELADELADLEAELADLLSEELMLLAAELADELSLLATELADEETLEAEDEAEPVRLLRTEPWEVSARGRLRRLSDRESYLGRR